MLSDDLRACREAVVREHMEAENRHGRRFPCASSASGQLVSWRRRGAPVRWPCP